MADADFEIIRGSILPQLPLRFLNSSGAPINLASATAMKLLVAHEYEVPEDQLLIYKDLTLVDAAQGRAIAAWADDDTNITAGLYQAGVILTFPSGPAKLGPFTFLVTEAILNT